MDTEHLLKTPLAPLHAELEGKIVPFAGHAMPVQYSSGILAEHRHVREAAGLFDVSHMGQAELTGPKAAQAIERLVPGDIQGLAPGRMRYSMLLNDAGGIEDDLMITRLAEDRLFLVVNAACKDRDFKLIAEACGSDAALSILTGRALIALQGPRAAEVLSALSPEVATMPFMSMAEVMLDGIPALVSRSGYTGEDGYEISVADDRAEALARRLLDSGHVSPIGLGARDSLRLEAGLCLYGADIDATTTPVEAALTWAIGKRRREAADFPGADKILKQREDKPARKRVGIRPEGRQPARAHTAIVDDAGAEVGVVTSGGFGPTVGGPVAMGYVRTELAEPGTAITLSLRGRAVPATVERLPFVKQNYYRGD